MVFLFIILIPVYFVPVLNVLAFSLPFYYFFHKLLNFDVSSTILSKEQFKIIYKAEGNNFRLRTLFLYFISMIPFATLFTAVYYIIYLGHAYFIKLDELSKIDTQKELGYLILLIFDNQLLEYFSKNFQGVFFLDFL